MINIRADCAIKKTYKRDTKVLIVFIGQMPDLSPSEGLCCLQLTFQ